MTTRCALCGRDPAAGFAKIGDDRYCHGDEDLEPTCYMQAQSILAGDPGAYSATRMLP